MNNAAENSRRPLAGRDSDGSQALAEALRLSFAVLRVVMIVLLALTLLRSSLFVVPQQEKAFVLRFGRITGRGDDRVRGPGLHLAFPAPIDQIVRLPGERMLTVASDSFYHGVDDVSVGATQAMRRRPFFNVAMTADRNLLHSRWTTRYTVVLPEAYVFGFDQVENLLRHELDRAVLLATARMRVDRALRSDRELRETVHRTLARRIDELGLGVVVHQVESDRMEPPPAIAGAFDNVIMAEQESNEIVSQARIEAAAMVGRARAEAADRLAAAHADAVRRTENTAAQAAGLTALVDAGIVAPDDLAVYTLWMEKMSRLLGAEDGPRIIRLRAAPQHRRLRLLLGD